MESKRRAKKRALREEVNKKQVTTTQKLKNNSKEKNTQKHRKTNKMNKTKVNSGFNVVYTNTDQLTNSKKTELFELIENHKPHIIAMCEVKPKNGRERTLLDYKIPGYSLHSTNLCNNIGRGLAIYTHFSLDSRVVKIDINVECEESCLLEIKTEEHDTLLFGCIYRSPTTTKTSAMNNENINQLLKQISSSKYSHICIVGDFNYKNINWNTWTTPYSEQSKEAKFIETIRDCFLYQHVMEPTRSRGNDEPSLIDLILTNEEMQVSDINYLSPIGKSDHSVVSFTYKCYVDFDNKKTRHNYQKADFVAMRENLEKTMWKEKFIEASSNMEINDLWLNFKSKMIDLRDSCVPKTTISPSPDKIKGRIPVSKKTRDAIRNKTIAHRRWINMKRGGKNFEEAHQKFKKARNKVKSLMQKLKKEMERNIARKSKSNPKAFWTHIRKHLKTKAGIAPLLENINDKNSKKFDDHNKAAILQKQFSSVFNKESLENMPNFDQRSNSKLESVIITKDMVEKLINNLQTTKSFGPDELHPAMLKELVDFITEPITIIFNRSMNEGILPNDWKVAHITAIYKKGDSSNPENYRPISLTSVICKMLETLVKTTVMQHLVREELLSTRQYGFIKGRSTTTQLLSYLEEVIDVISAGGVVDTIYFDFAKAFDSVPHQRLLMKLRSYGLDSYILDWIKDFLTNRTQIVKINDIKSESAPVLSGIPQGSVLGPLLFVIYINDLPECVSSTSYLYADDTKMFKKILNMNDALNLQSDINQFQEWSEKWFLKFHPDKCHVLILQARGFGTGACF